MRRRPSFGKENSPSKKTPKRLSMAVSFSRLGEDFANLPQTSSPKHLKQVKLNFERSKQNKVNETDATFCEELEKRQEWKSKSKLNSSTETSGKKKKLTPVQKAKTIAALFEFHPPPVKVQAPSKQIGNNMQIHSSDVTPDASVLFPRAQIKEEKLSESDLDIFASEGDSSRGSSVMCMGPQIEQLITIADNTVDNAILASLERDFLQQTEYESILPEPEPLRKRKQIYGECKECRDFYDKFAEVNGASQADDFLRTCPNKCKAWNYRHCEAQPKQSRIFLPPQLDTPSGIWSMRFSPRQSQEDPDKTQDGL